VARFTTNKTPTISWDSVPGVVQTEVWLKNWTTQQGKVVNAFVPDGQNSYTFDMPLDLGHYGVWIRHSFLLNGETVTGPWSQAAAMSVRTIAEAPVVTLGAENQISWTTVPGATSYRVWINDGAGTRILYEPAALTTTLTLPPELPADRYTVWVIPQAIHPTDSWRTAYGTWSAPVRFRIGATVTGVTVNAGNQLISLSVVPGVVRSEFWLNKLDPWTQKIVYDDNVSATAVSYTTSIITPGSYRVWIRSLNAAGRWSAWSVPVDFVVT